MKKIFTFIFVSVLTLSCWGTVYQVGSDDYEASTGPTDVYNNYFVSQILYLQSSIIATGAEAGSITSISFWVKSGVAQTRKFEVYISASSVTQLSGFTSQSVDDKLFDGNVDVPSSGWYTIALTKSFTWDGISNLLITINDKTNKWGSSHTTHYGMYNGYFGKDQIAHASKNSGPAYDATNLTASVTLSKYYPTIKFNIEATPIGPTYNAPTNVSVTTTSTTATISWTKEADAKIKLQHSPKAADDWTTVNDIDAASYTITGLFAETEYEYKVSAVYEGGESEEVQGFFTTASVGHEHDGIAFLAWNETTALPIAAGSYFLKNDVTVSSWPLPDGDTKICLNGKTITITGTSSITVGSEKSLSIYDNEGNGKVTAGLNFAATVRVNAGGTLSLYGGTIENTGTGLDAFAVNVASGTGTLNIKGDVKILSNAANIRLAYENSVITLVGALTNTTKLSVSKDANQDITSGWSTYMSSANPADYFSSKNASASAVILVGEEAQLSTPQVTISETGANIITDNQTTNVNLVRTFMGNILNTISLPFALSDAQMQTAFGADYELYQLSSSSLFGTVLDLNFDRVTSLNATYPYLLRVSADVVNPSFNSVTLKTGAHSTNTTAVDMIPVISEKEVVAREYNLFLNAAGELNWATTDSQFKGMRAYFQVKAEIPSSISVRRINIRNTPTDVETIEHNANVTKSIENGQLVILKNGVKYNVQGQIIK